MEIQFNYSYSEILFFINIFLNLYKVSIYFI